MKKIITALFILFGLHAIAGSVDTIEMKSAYLKKAVKFVIVQPSKQSQKNSIQERYPVVYLLNGYDGNYAQWSKTAPQLAKTSDDLKLRYKSSNVEQFCSISKIKKLFFH